MLKKTKTKFTIISIATIALAGAASVIFIMKKDENNSRIAFIDIDQAPVQASVLPLRNHDIITSNAYLKAQEYCIIKQRSMVYLTLLRRFYLSE